MLASHRNLHIATVTAGALALVIGTIPDDAFGQRRGGGGGGQRAATSVHRGGGGGQAAGRAQAGQRPAGAQRPAGGGNRAYSGGGGNRTYAGGGGNRAYAGGGNTVNRGGGGNTVNRGGNRVNTGNVNIGNDVNIDVDRGWDNDGWGYHPVARGVAFGTAAAVTSAVVGSMIYSLPPSCRTVVYGPTSYSQCGNVWYMPQYSGSSVAYVVVNAPY